MSNQKQTIHPYLFYSNQAIFNLKHLFQVFFFLGIYFFFSVVGVVQIATAALMFPI